MIRTIRHQVQHLFGQRWEYTVDPETGIRRRTYRSYEEYVRHQAAKLPRNFPALKAHDAEYEEIVYERYSAMPLRGASILCLGARLGGEVRAFTRLGALAIGVDLEPGPRNTGVLPGDVHNLQFAPEVFDFAFTNILDHILHIEDFLRETKRVLKEDGRLILELGNFDIGAYEVNDLRDQSAVRSILLSQFQIEREQPIRNKTTYTDWSGQMLVLKRQ